MMSDLCKKKDFGNCGPPADNEYCIFHKPNKNAEEAKKFYKELRKKEQPKRERVENEKKRRMIFRGAVNWKGYEFPQIPKGEPFSFRRVVFQREATFSNATFEGDVDFWSSTFKKGAIFHGVEFKKEVDFGFANFKDLAIFSKSKFQEKAGFELVSFDGLTIFSEALFNGEAIFVETELNDEANFYRTNFKKDGLFMNVTFGGSTIMNSSVFEALAIFSEADFKDKAGFDEVLIEGEGNFQEVEFENEAYFKNAKFGDKTNMGKTTFHGFADFSGIKFDGCLTMKNSNFQDLAIFTNSTFKRRANFKNINFDDSVRFSNAIFERPCNFVGTKFRGDLSFGHADFRQGVEMIEDPYNYPTSKYASHSAEEEGCRVQRLSYEEEGRKEEADEMFIREMRSRRKQKHRLARAVEITVADLTCKYGTSWERVLKASGFTILLFSLIYWIGVDILNVGAVETTSGGPPTYGILNYFYYSILTFVSLGFGDLRPLGTMKVFTSIEAMLGVIFVALIVVVFARKWMR